MTDKTMPERIWAWCGCADARGWSDSNGLHRGSEKYIRADLVPAPSSADEPLEAGQYRWVRHKATPGWLDIARVSVEHDGMWMNETSGDAYKADQYVYIGPVIQPPPGQSN